MTEPSGLVPPPTPLLPRGVYRAPCLSAEGFTVLFAVDASHRFVEGSRVELQPNDNPFDVTAALWRLLDAADPEHSRRELVRSNAPDRESTRKAS